MTKVVIDLGVITATHKLQLLSFISTLKIMIDDR